MTYWGYHTLKIDSSIIYPNIIATELNAQINNEDTSIKINNSSLELLKENQLWAMVIQDETGNVIWSNNLPKEIPTSYSRKDIALFARYYLKDYPVFTYVNNKGLLVLGYPKDSYGKIPTNAFPLKIVHNLPITMVYYFIFNLFIVFVIYMISKRKLLKSVNPISDAICKISKGEKILLEETGDLSDIKVAINETSRQLRERYIMRANWIAGISHDIRTPLSLILGYSNHLLKSQNLNKSEHEELKKIVNNSIHIQDLISNLNLTSRLEYNLVPMEIKNVSVVKILREIIVDYMNKDMQDPYDFEFISDILPSSVIIHGDRLLLERAFRNIILNSIKHNPKGCKIKTEVVISNTDLKICIFDNGIGTSQENLVSLNASAKEGILQNTKTKKSHGLGLLIVKQIIELHKGSVHYSGIEHHGFKTIITLPIEDYHDKKAT